MAPPIVEGIDQIVLINGTLDASDLFNANDPDGDPITMYEFEDQTGTGSGRFELSGVAQDDGSVVTVNPTDLNNLIYVGGTGIGREDVYVRVFANGAWSNRAQLTIFTVRSNVTTPLVNATDFSVVSPERIAASSFINSYDPDGWPIQRYFIRDRFAGAGKFYLDGVAQTEATTFVVTAEEFSKLYYEGAQTFASEPIDIWVHDGAELSEHQAITARTLENVNRPVIFYKEINVPLNGGLKLFPLIDWTDPDGNTIKSLRVRDASPQSFSSYIRLNGRERDPQVWIDVDAADFDNLEIVGGSRRHSSPIFVQFNDGRHNSAIQQLKINTVERPAVASDDFVIHEDLDPIPLTELFDKIDDGEDPVGYEIVDGTSGFTSGRFEEGLTQFAANQVHSITATQYNNMIYRAAAYGPRAIDDVYVRADNGTFKSIWKRVEIATEPNYDELLLQDLGGSYGDWIEWNSFGGADPFVITYSFMQSRTYDPGAAFFEPDIVVNGFGQFSGLQRDATRSILNQISTATNLQFVEISDNVVDQFGRRGGLMRLGNFADPNLGGYITGTPDNTVTFQPGGDLWVNALLDLRDLSLGSARYYELMGQIARAVAVVAPGPFPNEQNWSNFTVKAPAISRFFVHGGFERPSSYSVYDIHALQKLYGRNANGNAGDDLYDIAGWLEGNQDRISTIWDGAGNDTLSAVGADNPAIIDLREGQFSTIGSIPENVAIAFEAVIENAIGSDHDDMIQGNQHANILEGGLGNDTIRSGSGNDLMNGGRGDDIYHYGIGDGLDKINEQRQEGVDTLVLDAFPTLNSMADLRFRKSGPGSRDLIIDLVLDGGESQGYITIETQRWARSRIETLSVFGGTRIDLASIYDQSTTTNQEFELLGTTTTHGFLAQPVV